MMLKEKVGELGAILRLLSQGAKEEKLKSYAVAPEIIAFTFVDPFAFLIGVLADYQIPAGRAWAFPYYLRDRLGELTPKKVAETPLGILAEKIREPKSLHRFPFQMAMNVQRAAYFVCAKYRCDALNIWATDSLAKLQERLLEFRGMGDAKKVPMMIKMLIRDWGLNLASLSAIHIAYDEHTRRVLLRAGLMEKDSVADIELAGCRLSPVYPAKYDDAIWLIGRNFCHPQKPDCENCPFAKACAKKNIRQTAEL